MKPPVAKTRLAPELRARVLELRRTHSAGDVAVDLRFGFAGDGSGFGREGLMVLRAFLAPVAAKIIVGGATCATNEIAFDFRPSLNRQYILVLLRLLTDGRV